LKRFRAAQGAAQHWGLATKACLDALGGVSAEDTCGWLYVSQDFAGDLGSIVTFLRETTPVRNWVGGVGFAVHVAGAEPVDGGAVAIMVGALPEDSIRLFDDADPETFRASHGEWLGGAPVPVGLVHGDPAQAAVAQLAGLAEASGAFLFGGLTASQEDARVAGTISPPGLSGALFKPPVGVMIGLSQGCTPIGPPHRVTEAVDNVLMAIDGRSALQVLREEAGDIIARDLRRAAGYIHAAAPVTGSDRGDYTVRSLTGIDPQRGWLALGSEVETGEELMFVRRDANAAQRDLRRMAADMRERLARRGEAVLGALYIACVARGANMFGSAGREMEILGEELGTLPLVGFSANGEVCRDRLYTYTGVLAVFVGGAQ
jgi:small ligand-binding sensory domain FIST